MMRAVEACIGLQYPHFSCRTVCFAGEMDYGCSFAQRVTVEHAIELYSMVELYV